MGKRRETRQGMINEKRNLANTARGRIPKQLKITKELEVRRTVAGENPEIRLSTKTYTNCV
jgi:hypothetical protein